MLVDPSRAKSTRRIADFRELQLQLKIAPVVKEVLTFSPGIEFQVLADRLAKFHNRGLINCTADQMGAIQARLGISSAVLSSSTEDEGDGDHMTAAVESMVRESIAKGEETGGVVGNAEYLAL